MACLGVLAIVLGMAFAVLGKGGKISGKFPRPAVIVRLLSRSHFWIMMAVFGMGVGSSLGIYTMMPLYLLHESNLDPGWVNTLVSLSPGVGFVSRLFVSGWVSDRIGPRRTLAGILFFAGICTILLGFLKGTLLVVMVFLQPALAACFFPPAFAALSRIVPPEMRNLAVSLAVPLGFIIGSGLIPTWVGYTGELGRFGLGIATVGLVVSCGPLLLRSLDLDHSAE